MAHTFRRMSESWLGQWRNAGPRLDNRRGLDVTHRDHRSGSFNAPKSHRVILNKIARRRVERVINHLVNDLEYESTVLPIDKKGMNYRYF